ncbi:unnamed protein product [Adineta ricciae]|uniref:Apple domain-containing protein n=1 Tax=Adineta ricciae TaxID=249248 RepID=A0A814DY09_ADIRI|nr:unnamed protein product [Adineta ricciae]CAF0960224.1 unnamed protein product [Adineta ricciae]
MLLIFFTTSIFLPINAIYQSRLTISSAGYEFQPRYSIQLLTSTTTPTIADCSLLCNQLLSCRILDFDSLSERCRLFEADTITAGSIIVSSSSTSQVGTVHISSDLYVLIHNRSCNLCQEYRYETCAENTNICQCPRNSYWNGSVCALQLLENDTCVQRDACRSDLNLTCAQDYFDDTSDLGSTFGITVIGSCIGNLSTDQTFLASQSDITIDGNNTIYVGDNSNRMMSFAQNNCTARVLKSFSSWPTFAFYDNKTSWLYGVVMVLHLVYIWPINQTIPASGISYQNCSMNSQYYPSGIAVDSVGNVYVSSYYCNWVVKWAPNATSGTLAAGSMYEGGSTDYTLYAPYNIALDEENSFLYVVDRYNHRVQRFLLNGTGQGVTVAGGNGQGSAQNQLDRPTDIYLSRSKTEIYIGDSKNNRVQKWVLGQSSGTTVAGSPNGTSGRSPYLMNTAYGIAVDYEEKYLYVSDSLNNRIQRFSLRRNI